MLLLQDQPAQSAQKTIIFEKVIKTIVPDKVGEHLQLDETKTLRWRPVIMDGKHAVIVTSGAKTEAKDLFQIIFKKC